MRSWPEAMALTVGTLVALSVVIWLVIRVMGWVEEWLWRQEQEEYQKRQQERCPVCQRGNGVLLNEDDATTGWPDWCNEHVERMGRIRELEREVFDGDGLEGK